MSLANFTILNTYTGIKTHQSVYSDGTNIWTTNAGNSTTSSGLYRYNMTPTLLTSNNDAADDITGAEDDVWQMNGIEKIAGKLYIGAMNFPNGNDSSLHNAGDKYQRSYITRWDPTTLAYEAKWAVGDSSVLGPSAVARWTEGCAYHEGTGHLFVIFHGNEVAEEYSFDGSGDLVFVARHTFPSVDNTNQGANFLNSRGFEDITFSGDTCWLNRHAATSDPYFYEFKWNGSGFDFVQKIARLGDDFTQGVNIQPGTNITWWCERTTSGGDTEGSISKVISRGLDLSGRVGVGLSFETTGVKYADSSGIIVSK